MNTHKREKENIKKRIEKAVFNTCSRPMATASECVFRKLEGF